MQDMKVLVHSTTSNCDAFRHMKQKNENDTEECLKMLCCCIEKLPPAIVWGECSSASFPQRKVRHLEALMTLAANYKHVKCCQ